MNIIEIRQVLPNVFRGREIKSDIWEKAVTFNKDNIYLIEAASGTGKSSLCSFVYGYRDDYDGKILFEKEDISRYTASKWTDIRQKSLAILFQELRIFPELTAMENIKLKNNLTHRRTDEEIKRWLERFEIADKALTLTGKLSFGQQQRIAFIRALCQPYDFIFLDEPISHLDEDNARIMGDILQEEKNSDGVGVILTSIGRHLAINYDKILRL